LESVEGRLEGVEGRLEGVEGRLELVGQNLESLVRLVIDVKESFEREMRAGLAAINTRFDTQAARLDRQASLIQVGSRWTARMNEWTEKVDAALEQKDREIADLRKRIDRLESNGRHPDAA